MSRLKFNTPKEPTENEMLFIDYMEDTHDFYGLSERTLSVFLNVSARKLRTYKEKYNNFLFIGIMPQGKIHNINKLYRMIRQDSKYRTRSIYQANYNLICAAIDKRNTAKILGTIQALGQISMSELLIMNSYDLVKLAKEYEELLEGEN